VAAGHAIFRHLAMAAGPAERASAWEARLRVDLAETTGVAGDGVVAFAPAPLVEGLDVAQDLVQLEKPVRRWPVPDDLQAAIEAHGRALRAGDRTLLESPLTPAARASAADCYRELSGLPAPEVVVVACGRVGRQWLVKQRLVAPNGVHVLQTRWVPGPAGWEIAEAEVVRREPPP
jgi:hypothetical protein